MVENQPINGYNTFMIKRNITDNLLEALSDSPVVLLNGARQTGKSTLANWLSTRLHNARYLTMDNATVLAAAQLDPEGFLAGIQGNVVLDEIQRIPELFRAIKFEVDRNRRPGRFLLTGSANILLLPRLSESLAGRVEILTLWPFSQGEIQGVKENFMDEVFAKNTPSFIQIKSDKTGIINRIVSGGYPEAIKRSAPARRKAWFGSYITTILQRDVRDISNIEGLTAMPRLLSLLAARTSSLLNFAELSRSSGLPQSTLKRYMTLLETTFLITLLPAWSGNLGKRIVKAPKLFLTDTGLASYLLGLNEQRLSSEGQFIGPLFENFVIMELIKQSAWSKTEPQIFHFRTQTGLEVDIVLEDSEGKIVGIEVKASTSLNVKDYYPLRILSESVGKKFHRGILLYRGTEPVPFGHNLFALPVQTIWENGIKNK